MALIPLSPVPEIHERLQVIFPEGISNRNYVTREIAAKTVFTMPYVGAVEGTDRWLRPDQVTRMTIATEAGFKEEQVVFVTAYADRGDAAFKATASELAWSSFAWFMSEPNHIMMLHRGADAEHERLSDLM